MWNLLVCSLPWLRRLLYRTYPVVLEMKAKHGERRFRVFIAEQCGPMTVLQSHGLPKRGTPHDGLPFHSCRATQRKGLSWDVVYSFCVRQPEPKKKEDDGWVSYPKDDEPIDMNAVRQMSRQPKMMGN